jgi:hypothetical protein
MNKTPTFGLAFCISGFNHLCWSHWPLRGLAREEAGTANQFLVDRHIYVHLRQTIFPHRPILVLYCLQ